MYSNSNLCHFSAVTTNLIEQTIIDRCGAKEGFDTGPVNKIVTPHE
jgi:hypothetical protein